MSAYSISSRRFVLATYSDEVPRRPLVGNPVKYLLKLWISSLALLSVRLAVSPGAYEFDPTA